MSASLLALAAAWGTPSHGAPDDGEPDGEAPSEAPQPADLPITVMPSIDPESYVEPVIPDAVMASLPADQTTATVVLRIGLLADGTIANTEVVESDGEAFSQALIEALPKWAWSPARTEAGPVDATFPYSYTFELKRDVVLPVNLTGVVREMATRNLLGDVSVSVRVTPEEGGDPVEINTTTDPDGRFELRGVPAGLQEVRLVHGGHRVEQTEIQVVDGERTEVKLWMTRSGLSEELVVVGEREKEEVTRYTLSIEEIKRVPGTFGDPVKVIQTLPGAARTPFGTGLLVIRAPTRKTAASTSTASEFPSSTTSRATTSVLSPELIDSVDYLPGGYGVQYGRTMGGTIDVKTKKASATTRSWCGAPTSSTPSCSSKGRWGRTRSTESRSGRAVPTSTCSSRSSPAAPGSPSSPATGLPVQVGTAAGGRHPSLHLLVRLRRQAHRRHPDDVAQGADQDTQGDLGIQYNSHRVVGHWRKKFGERLALDFTPSLGIDTSNLGSAPTSR